MKLAVVDSTLDEIEELTDSLDGAEFYFENVDGVVWLNVDWLELNAITRVAY